MGGVRIFPASDPIRLRADGCRRRRFVGSKFSSVAMV
nr:MAG TPA: Metallothionein, cadmium ion, METAL BINDING [Caudoviricetes sp.]